MKTAPEDFLTWAEDPARSVEERYTIVRLTEYVYSSCHRESGKVELSYQEERQMREDRCYNAAYDPVPDTAMLRITSVYLPTLKEVSFETHLTDRPIRDLEVLAFVPGIVELRLRNVEMDRLKGLRHVPNLLQIRICTDEVEDYRDLALCRELRKISIQTWHPWPVLEGLETLPHLEQLMWLSNARSLAGIKALPHLKMLSIDSPSHHVALANSMKDLYQLPEMPQLETLWGGCFYRLDGVGRLPRLRVVCLNGFFKSLAPLAELKEVTHVRVVSPRIEEVGTIAGMPSVFQFAIKSIRPQDWSPLFDSGTLWDVYQDGCEAPQPDYHTLRMLLPSQADVFGSPESRPHEPLRLRVYKEDGDPMTKRAVFPEGPAGWDGCLAMRQCEIRWVNQELYAGLEEAGLLKLKGVRFDINRMESHHMFSKEPASHTIRRAGIQLLRTEAIGSLGSIVECLRTVMLRMRYPWQIYFMLCPEADAEDWDDTWREDDSLEERIQEQLENEREAERARQRRQLFLKDEQRLQLLKELGHDPAEFRRSTLQPEEAPLEITIRKPSKDKDGQKDAKNEDNEGGLAEPDPDDTDEDESWLAPVEISNPNNEWRGFFMNFILTEDAIWIGDRRKDPIDALTYLLDIAPEYPEGFTPGPEEDDD